MVFNGIYRDLNGIYRDLFLWRSKLDLNEI